MSYFLNLNKGKASIGTTMDANALVVDMVDIIAKAGDHNSASLTTNLSDYLDAECKKTLSEYGDKFRGRSESDVSDAVLGDLDFLYQAFSAIESDEYLEYPDLRDAQHDLIRDICEQSKIN